MSQRKSSEPSKRRVFSEEFKQDAVRLVARGLLVGRLSAGGGRR